MLLYSVCYYYGKNNLSNLINHLNCFLKVDIKDKQFIIVCMIDSHDINYFKEIEQTLSDYINNYKNNIKFKILTSFNWGGTILGLWLTYNYGKIYNDHCYIAHFEEDFYPFNDKWVNCSIDLLNSDKNYIYIGEVTRLTEDVKMIDTNCDKKCTFLNVINEYNNSTFKGLACWTDGGFYLSSIKKLRVVEENIGIFHKGNNNKYDHFLDGIILGEVGFPTLLHHNGFSFIGIPRCKYFIHNEN
jgi:hypothetical protein